MDDFTIINLQDLTTATGLTENDFLAIGQGSNALTKATIQQVGALIGISASVVLGDKDVEPTVPSFAFADSGVYSEWGNTEIEGDLGILIYDGVSFSKTEISFIANGVVEEGNTQAVSGGEVYSQGFADATTIMLMHEQYGVLSTTLNPDEVISSANIQWEDGATGVLTFADYNLDWLAYDSYTITHQDRTVTQPKVTRDSNGTIIISPLKTIS